MATEKVSAPVYDKDGKESGHLELPEGIFNAPVNTAVLHQAVKRQQANDRQGSTRSPQWRHGGVVFGPHPHSYEEKMPRKQRRLALRVALSVKSQEGAVRVVEEITLEAPKTSVVANLFDQLGAGVRTLFVIPEHDLMLEKSTRNLVGVKTILATNLNPTDVLTADTLIFTRSAITQVEEWLS